MREALATALWVIGLLAFAGSIVAFVIALFPWSLFMLGVPIFVAICISMAGNRR
jgi:hypothetical protein